LAPEGIFGFPGCVEVQLVRRRSREIKMKQETREDGLGKGEAQGMLFDGTGFRDEHKIVVIGQWSFVIGQWSSSQCKMKNDQ
jgi:hypothetical protein